MNLPIYRAKKIDSDEYITGNYIKVQNKYYIYEDGTSDIYLDDEECFEDGSINGEIRIYDLIFEIDPSTLAIHFEDMLDSEGNKIFASLSEDGKGGDIVEYNTKKEVVKYSLGTIQTYMFRFEDLIDLEVKVIGIHK